MKIERGMLKLMLCPAQNGGRMWCPSESVEAMLCELPFVEQVHDAGAQAASVIVEFDSIEQMAQRLPEYEATILAIIEKRAMPREFRPCGTWETIFGHTIAGLARYLAARQSALGF